MTVAQLLAASFDAHREYRQLAGTLNKDGSLKNAPNPVAALAAVTRARDLRQEAHDADPDHLDPAWGTDSRVSHDALMAFYNEHIPKRTEKLELFQEQQRFERAIASVRANARS